MVDEGKLRPPGKPNMFGLPRGLLGTLAGWIMAHTNQVHNAWAVARLDPQPDDHVLEIGFGPGTALALLAARIDDGFIAGVDPSPVMLRQATRRNAAAVQAGKMKLVLGTVSELPFKDQTFDKVLSVNTIMMWPGPTSSLREVYRVMRPGGRLVIALNPRWAKSHQDVKDMGDEIATHATNAGFVAIKMDSRDDLKPFGAVCVSAHVPRA